MKCRIKNCNHWKHYKHCKQSGEFLNRYYFAYPRRDTANTAILSLNRITPGLIKKQAVKLIKSLREEYNKQLIKATKKLNVLHQDLSREVSKNFTKTASDYWDNLNVESAHKSKEK